MIARLAGCLLVATAACAVNVAPAQADTTWNSVAYSVTTDASGYAYSSSHDEAERLAIGYCSRNGAPDCIIAATADGGCLAAAVNGSDLKGGLGPTEQAAKDDATRDGGSAVLSWCP